MKIILAITEIIFGLSLFLIVVFAPRNLDDGFRWAIVYYAIFGSVALLVWRDIENRKKPPN